MSDLVLVGGGGHALSVMEVLPGSARPVGYVDFADVPGMTLPRLGDDAAFLGCPDVAGRQVLITMVSGRSCSLTARARLVELYDGFDSPVVVAPSAIVARNVALGKGTVVFHRAVVNVGSLLGKHCVVNTGAVVEHGCRIGDNVFIGPGSVVCGGVEIGDNVYVGANAVLRPGISVCSGSTIGLGAAVVSDIKSPGVYAGVPAKIIKK